MTKSTMDAAEVYAATTKLFDSINRVLGDRDGLNRWYRYRDETCERYGVTSLFDITEEMRAKERLRARANLCGDYVALEDIEKDKP